MLAGYVFTLLFLSLAIAAATLTIAKGKIFTPARMWLIERWPWGGKAISCAYCLSHWFAFALVAVVGGVELTQRPVLDWLITSFAVVALSALIEGGIAGLLMMRDAEIAEMKQHMADMIERLGTEHAKEMAKLKTGQVKDDKKDEKKEEKGDDDGIEINLDKPSRIVSGDDAVFPNIFAKPKKSRSSRGNVS